MSTLPPGTPPPQQPAAANPLPWEARESRGFFQSFLDTWGLFLSRPQEAWNRARESGDLASPLIFGLIACWIALLLQKAISGLIAAPMMPGFLGRRFPGLERLPMGRLAAGGLVMHAILSPIAIFIGLFVGAAVLHVCCMIVGALTNSRSGFEGTFRAVAYSETTYIAAVVPVVGGLIALVWWIIVAVMGLQRMHHTTSGKAIAAILIPIVLCCVCIVVVVLLAGAAIFMHGHR
ncbi:MAG TPA: YIP1 family protein [Thermoanaerobaculia bacterium]|nr:YIP1 family protein [Thermoanaerobaculia bacterium]